MNRRLELTARGDYLELRDRNGGGLAARFPNTRQGKADAEICLSTLTPPSVGRAADQVPSLVRPRVDLFEHDTDSDPVRGGYAR